MSGFVRAFIAHEMPWEIQSGLAEITSQLKRGLDGLPMRWVQIGNIHLTLKFVGDLAGEKVREISQFLEKETEGLDPFEVKLSNLGVFPEVRSPRVLWVGLQAPQAMLDFQRQLEEWLSALGVDREQRRFSPHLTIARFKRSLNRAGSGTLKTSLDNLKPVSSTGTIDSITLFKSQLKPDGPVYNRLVQIKLERRT